MLCLPKCAHTRCRQCGQVLAEAVVVMLLLVVLVGALFQTGLWQHRWSAQWLKNQMWATAWSLDHQITDTQAVLVRSQAHGWHDAVMADYRIGASAWYHLKGSGRFSKRAWRLGGVGQASRDHHVTARIGQASRLWGAHAAASKRVVGRLMPSLEAVEAPWRERSSATDWLNIWQGSTPAAYLGAPR